MHSSLYRLLLLAAASFLLSPPAAETQGKGKGKTGTNANIPLTVTFRDGSGDHIGSDKAADGAVYVHGEDGVGAEIDFQNWNGRFWLTIPSNGTRWLGLDFDCDNALACTELCGTSVSPCYDSDRRGPLASVEAKGVGMSLIEDGMCLLTEGVPTEFTMGIFFDDPSGDPVQWFAKFKPDDTLCGESDKVTVTRTETGWTIDSNGVACQLSMNTRGRSDQRKEGLFSMPFHATLTPIDGTGCPN